MEIKKIDELYAKVIQKAMENGWQPSVGMKDYTWCVQNGNFMMKSSVWSEQNGKVEDFVVACNIEKIIFDHAFAEALWGSELFVEDGLEFKTWEENLQELVMCTDRVEYLKSFV